MPQIRKYRERTLMKNLRKPKAPNRFIFLPLALAAIATTALLLTGLGALLPAQAAQERTILSGITIDGIDVAGMTKEQAKARIDEEIAARESAGITLVGQGEGQQVRVTPADLGIRYSADNAVDTAVAYGHATNVIARFKQKRDMEQSGMNIPMDVEYDPQRVETEITNRCSGFNREAVDATLTRENGKFVVVPGQSGVIVNAQETAQRLLRYLTQDWNGRDTVLDIDMVVDEPKGKTDELSQIGDVLGMFSTNFSSSGADRSANIANGCRLVSGTILYPGEEFSMLQHITPFTEENGYHLAGSYLGNKVVDSLGGGICQVSTTLYNAVIRAELTVTARSNHSMMVGYVEPSMDAAIAESAGMDFRFRNDSDHPIYIDGNTDNKNITFYIYGIETRSPDRKVSFESETIETTPSEGTVIEQDPTLPVGDVHVSSGHTGYKAQLWKIVTENGQQVSREVFNRSTYNMTPQIVTVGTAGNVTAELQAAMAAQDVAAIRAAAEQAKSGGGTDQLTAAAGEAAQQAYADALAAGQDTSSAMEAAKQAANAVVNSVGGSSESSGNSESSSSSESSGNSESSGDSGSASE